MFCPHCGSKNVKTNEVETTSDGTREYVYTLAICMEDTSEIEFVEDDLERYECKECHKEFFLS